MLALLLLLATGLRAISQVNVTTAHNDIGRTGQNLSETILTTSNVNPTQFGKLFSQPVDGQIYAQPLYMSGITVNGAVHNVVYVATENDSVYAFDADMNGGANASPLWFASMLSTSHGAAAGATAIPSSILSSDIQPILGITGTPVIDSTTGTLYVVSGSLESNVVVQRLHALDITTGLEKFGGPVVIKASVPGTGNGSVNGVLDFDPMWQNQRPGLLLLNGIVWMGFGSHGDNGPWHGWILGYNAATLAQTGAFCSTPNGVGGGIWMAGGGLAADQLDPVNRPYGRMFVPSANGDYNASAPYTNQMDYGDSELDLDLTNGVPTITDEFTPGVQTTLDAQDLDLGSGGLLILPTQISGNYPHLAVQAGKQGTFYLLNRDNLGGYSTTADQVVQEQTAVIGRAGSWSSPAYWNGNIYWWGKYYSLESYALVNGMLSTSPTTSSEIYGYPGATLSISANGNTQGIVWSVDTETYPSSGPAVLQAHNASNVATTLYSSATNAARDQAGPAVKFAVPTIANGKVYVGAGGELDFYGLLSSLNPAATPVISPAGESFSTSVSAVITDSTPNASIYYTTDGSPATTRSTLYSGAITVSSDETIHAVASATGYDVSAQASAAFTDLEQVPPVTFSIAGGTYTSAQPLTLSDSTPNASIYYTTDGSTPTTSSARYSSPIVINTNELVTAMATAPSLMSSTPDSQTYVIQLGQTGINFTQGFSASSGLIIQNGSSRLEDTRIQLTDGESSETGSAFYYTPVNIQAFTTSFSFQLSNPNADGFTFTIQNAQSGTAAVGSLGGGLGYATIGNSVAIKFDLYNNAGEGSDSTGLYTDGAVPTVPAIDLSSTGINLHSGDQMTVNLAYNGATLTMNITDIVTSATWSTSWTVDIPAIVGSNSAYVGFTGGTGGETASQKILTWTYSVATPVPSPTFSPAAGAYNGPQTVSINYATSGATIYYTTNGSLPTTASSVYSAPIQVTSSETIHAMAIASGTPSPISQAAYTIAQVVATPTFAPGTGTYSSAQSVTISDATAGATIYYTTNGTGPTTSSAIYTSPIAVNATQTIKAIAVEKGLATSTEGQATYTISAPPPVVATPTFSPGTGTYSSAQSVTISDATAGATIYYTTNGTGPTTSSTIYTSPIAVSATETIKAIAVEKGLATSTEGQVTYTISVPPPVVATPTFSPGTGTYTSTQSVTISDATAGATIYYTTNGTGPTTSSATYTSPIAVNATQTIKAIAVEKGMVTSTEGQATFTINP
ncbi:chitobiase/beta-hexosaminidase C-terminal domain-containing protein [Acidicapsa dinghuensis]|uniref:Chitobiase/beta-hexosaminidase C-terminal domain-containing protein n=1 Tax=Acidicapsa dinghuensis TaxID=2218256 RepID=A0ABW1EIX8_9BACT|nr:chitobiase/beta-hexosaminidase C-terminal domain-containing protein [Acidicapsa dinghuensis]